MNFLFSSLLVITYIIKSYAATFRVICAPSDYGGSSVSVNIDGNSYPMVSANNDILFEYTFDGTPKNYYYEITGSYGATGATGATGIAGVTGAAALAAGAAVNELSLIENPRTWDQQSTSTLYEIYGRPYTLGDEIIKPIPRLYEPLEGYGKYSQLFQEGEVLVIHFHINPTDYAQLITITDDSFKINYNINFDLFTPYEKFHFTNATLKFSGQGSVTQEKKPFKIDLSENETEPTNCEIFDRKEFKLRSLRYDESYIKNKLAGDIAESLGLPIAQTAPCRLYINNKSYGLYEISDMYKKKFIRRFFNPEKNSDDYIYGAFYKGVSGKYPAYLYSDFPGTDISSLYDNVIPPTQNSTDPYADLKAMMTWLTNLQQNASKEEIEQKFDIDMFLKYALIEYLICHWDGYLSHGNNFFIYIEPNNGKYHILSYDFDMSFGKWCNAKTGTIGEYIANVVEPDKRTYGTGPQRVPLLYQKILANPNIEPLFEDLLKNVVTNLFNINALGPRIDYFFTFLKNDMYWDVECLSRIETKFSTGADVQDKPTINIINLQFSDADNDPENLKAFVKFKSNDLAKIYGITDLKADFKSSVGNKLVTIGDKIDETDDNKPEFLKVSGVISTVNKPTIFLFILSFFINLLNINLN
ncbi:coth-domain-containing protein [Neocallimastix sp. 'constans']